MGDAGRASHGRAAKGALSAQHARLRWTSLSRALAEGSASRVFRSRRWAAQARSPQGHGLRPLAQILSVAPWLAVHPTDVVEEFEGVCPSSRACRQCLLERAIRCGSVKAGAVARGEAGVGELVDQGSVEPFDLPVRLGAVRPGPDVPDSACVQGLAELIREGGVPRIVGRDPVDAHAVGGEPVDCVGKGRGARLATLVRLGLGNAMLVRSSKQCGACCNPARSRDGPTGRGLASRPRQGSARASARRCESSSVKFPGQVDDGQAAAAARCWSSLRACAGVR